MAAFFWLLAFVLYIKHRERRWFFALSLAAFFVSLLAKENSATLLPVLFAYDIVFSGQTKASLGRPAWGRYACYAAVFVFYCFLRFIAVGDFLFGGVVYPYFYTPSMPGFALHLLAMVLLYLFNLVSGLHTVPFFTDDLRFMRVLLSDYAPHLFFMALFLLCLAVVFRGVSALSRRLVFMAALGFITYLPASVMYMSERFLYLPSVGFAGMLALAFGAFGSLRIPHANAVAKILLALLILHYSVTLIDENAVFSRHTCPEFMISRFRLAVDDAALQEGSNVFILNYVDDYTCSVFLEDMLRSAYPGRVFSVRILTASRDRGGFSASWINGSAIEVVSEPLFRENRPDFRSRSLAAGDVVEMDLFSVSVLEASGGGVTRMLFTFREPFGRRILLVLGGDLSRFSMMSPWV
ncbi:MAG: hypothetical protein PHG85_02330 [Candidatus Altiarchaeota archaeon]|nr:hypothetical protein [Candidatus Altiarchaeota archaeon]